MHEARNTAESSLLTAKELAAAFGVSVASIGVWRRRGRLPCVFVSRRIIRYRLTDAVRAFERSAGEAVKQ